MTIGSFVADLNHLRSFHVRDGSNKELAYSFSPDSFFDLLTPVFLKSSPSKLAILFESRELLQLAHNRLIRVCLDIDFMSDIEAKLPM